ncbi:MAG TPA: RDD family protein [Streptosporangiaceae bacterium]
MADVVTGEAVVLDVPCARFPSRLAALGIDLLIQFVVMFVLLIIVGASASGQGLDAATAAALVITIIVLTLIGYPIIWETTTRGRSPGKFALGLRVVSDDGSPERFRQALVRGLATIVDFWLVPFIGVPALICSLLSAKGKRLGDVFAGTFVIQQRLPARRGAAARPPEMPAELAAWAAGLELSGLTDQTAAMARGYLGRLPELTPGARAELGNRIAAAVQAQIAPPPPAWTPVPVYLTAVLAERHQREQARLMPAAPARPATATAVPAAGPPAPGAGSPAAGSAAAGSAAAGGPWAAPAPPPPVTERAGQASEGEEAPAQPISPPPPGTGFAPPR